MCPHGVTPNTVIKPLFSGIQAGELVKRRDLVRRKPSREAEPFKAIKITCKQGADRSESHLGLAIK